MTDPLVETLLGIERVLLMLAETQPGSKEFAQSMQEHDRLYKRASVAQQGQYHALWAAEMQA